ncbi:MULTISPECIES: hypothetical protein [Diplocloster]|uniref:Uncharacterized protein n=2 Tax=Diplocloster TaxID=2918511 RepID=A0A949K313_9FIRM|nr:MULTISPECIES: hypothetical protein [Lachnospiraceae]SCI45345.1 Uncharacterised protein [uncultured Clostridium sp.]MBU9726151.1 hypothetical protein [Diplocloster modestus]MBU9735651.1 hypothetical protein [Diplocloster agilis]MBU9742998.1 hypothetical protein [Diplocloster agilis]MCU6732389.1 hypothetical protein [Suonthocola fibrivorans]
MKIQYDNRRALIHVLDCLDESETKQLLAFAAGYEACRKQLQTEEFPDETQKPPVDHS